MSMTKDHSLQTRLFDPSHPVVSATGKGISFTKDNFVLLFEVSFTASERRSEQPVEFPVCMCRVWM
jgi:hypothetical protein